jgi:CRISPR-associated endonuclease/helicase Cas3
VVVKASPRATASNTIPLPDKLSSKTFGGVPGVGVLEHCVAAGVVARELIEKLIPRYVREWVGTEVLKVFPLVVASHDVGKASTGFQYMIRGITIPFTDPSYPLDPVYGTLRHEVVSYEFLRTRISSFFSSMILYHHGYYRHGERTPEYGYTIDPVWELERFKIFNALSNYFEYSSTAENYTSTNLTIQKYLTGLMVVSDYISSDEKFFPPSGYTIESIPRRVSKALGHYGFYTKGSDTVTTELSFEEIFNFPPNSVQSEFISMVDGPGIYIYEDQMGGGKTEGALYPAIDLYRKGIVDGIYFGMPSQVTSNRIIKRMQDALDKVLGVACDVRLLHSNADVFHDPSQDDWFIGNKKAILDEFGVGTVDQMLLGVLPSVKHFFLRTFGLCRKAVIIDEVHSYDVYTSGLIRTLIQDLVEMDCVVIILSATLTEASKKELLHGHL